LGGEIWGGTGRQSPSKHLGLTCTVSKLRTFGCRLSGPSPFAFTLSLSVLVWWVPLSQHITLGRRANTLTSLFKSGFCLVGLLTSFLFFQKSLNLSKILFHSFPLRFVFLTLNKSIHPNHFYFKTSILFSFCLLTKNCFSYFGQFLKYFTGSSIYPRLNCFSRSNKVLKGSPFLPLELADLGPLLPKVARHKYWVLEAICKDFWTREKAGKSLLFLLLENLKKKFFKRL